MSREIAFTTDAWEEYLAWQKQDKKIVKKINQLLKECQRDPFVGTGKAEQLKGNFSGAWSRRITQEHRLVYTVSDTEIRVVACRFHYK